MNCLNKGGAETRSGTLQAVAHQIEFGRFTESFRRTRLEEFAIDPQLAVGQLPWFALQVRSRKEALVAAQLGGQGYECFFPTYKSLRKWSDRVKELDQPLFPGYLFCRFDFQNRRPLVMTPGVIQIVGIGSTPMPIADSEIKALELAVSSGIPSQPWPYLEVGEKVRVIYGSLSGLEGILINFRGNHRVVVSVTLLQRSVAMEVDIAWVSSLQKQRSQETAKSVVRNVVAVRSTN
jgi:transcription antitermination factor NusG